MQKLSHSSQNICTELSSFIQERDNAKEILQSWLTLVLSEYVGETCSNP